MRINKYQLIHCRCATKSRTHNEDKNEILVPRSTTNDHTMRNKYVDIKFIVRDTLMKGLFAVK